ncbi:MAG: glutathione peroxidase [Candidatus Eiseniibacteriota bacterium]
MTTVRVQRLTAIAALTGVWLTIGAGARAAGGKESVLGIYDFQVHTMADTVKSLADYRGKALLVVNTASRCGFTPQYKSLEALYQKYQPRGFEILAFPANNFANQEPGSNQEIASFCSANYHTTFPLFAKISVKGHDIAPLYQYLTHDSGFPGEIPWNFSKFLIAPDGRVVARWGPTTDPMSKEFTEKLEAVLPRTQE